MLLPLTEKNRYDWGTLPMNWKQANYSPTLKNTNFWVDFILYSCFCISTLNTRAGWELLKKVLRIKCKYLVLSWWWMSLSSFFPFFIYFYFVFLFIYVCREFGGLANFALDFFPLRSLSLKQSIIQNIVTIP